MVSRYNVVCTVVDCVYNYLAIEIISKQNDRMFLFFSLLCAFFCSIDSEFLQVYLAIYKRLLFTVVFSANEVFFIYISLTQLIMNL